MDGYGAVAQVFVERDFGDVQALRNLVGAELLFEVEGFGDDSRALGLLREAPLAAADLPPGAGRGQPGVGALANQLALKLRCILLDRLLNDRR